MRFCETCNKDKEDKSFKTKKMCWTCAHKRYKNSNRERFDANRRNQYIANRAVIIRRKREYRESSFKTFLSACIRKSKDRLEGRDNDIDVAYLLSILEKQKARCALSGVKLTHKFNDLKSVSIDRIDSKLGHVRGNIQLVCQFVNMGKKQFSNLEVSVILSEIKLNLKHVL